jgi:hypothetical protein
MIVNPNQHILDYLYAYLANPAPPYYALMIAGKWGTGKTWLVRQYFKTNLNHKYTYVSLYGAKSTEEVAERIFVARHPILTSKGAVIAGRVVKGLLKATTTIDLDKDNKGDVTIRSELPDVMDVVRKKASASDGTLVFDDIERCVANGNELWGFINYLVEYEGAKVILISNEDEIDDSKYRKTKEKNIGITLSVSADAGVVLDCLVEEFGEPAATALRAHRTRVLQLFERSDCSSLRVLRFAVRDFCRIFAELPNELQGKSAIASRLLDSTLHLALGVYSGELKPADIRAFDIGIFLPRPKEPTPLSLLARKYSGLGLGEVHPGLDWWRRFFERGEVQRTQLIDEYSKLANGAPQPNWLRLARFDELSDSEFEKIIEETWEWLCSRRYHSIGAILHVAATHMWAATAGVTRQTRSLPQIRDEAKRALDALEENDMLEDLRADHEGPLNAYAGIRYAAEAVVEFKELVEHAEENCRSAKLAVVRQEAMRLLRLMRESGQAFVAALGVDFEEEDGQLEKFALETSVLAAVDVEEFVRSLLSLSREDQEVIAGALYARLKRRMPEERKWVHEVVGRLAEESSGPSLRKHMLRMQLSRLAE